MVKKLTRRAQISIDLIASLFIYMLALMLVLSTVFRTYGLFSNSNFAERAGLISDRLSLLLMQSEGSPGWENDPTSATSVGFADGAAMSYEKIRAFAGLGVSEARSLLGITYDHRMKASYLPALVIDVGFENPKMVETGTAPFNTFAPRSGDAPGYVNMTIIVYDAKGVIVPAKIWATLSSASYGKASRVDSDDGSVSALMVVPAGGGAAMHAQRLAANKYRVSYDVVLGGSYSLRIIALDGMMFGDKEVTINVA